MYYASAKRYDRGWGQINYSLGLGKTLFKWDGVWFGPIPLSYSPKVKGGGTNKQNTTKEGTPPSVFWGSLCQKAKAGVALELLKASACGGGGILHKLSGSGKYTKGTPKG